MVLVLPGFTRLTRFSGRDEFTLPPELRKTGAAETKAPQVQTASAVGFFDLTSG